jgi:hypothetical protein
LWQDVLRHEVGECLQQGGPNRHILNVGHGVIQGTPVESVALFCEIARQSGSLREQAAAPHAVTEGDLQKLSEMGAREVGLVGC